MSDGAGVIAKQDEERREISHFVRNDGVGREEKAREKTAV
jgi:hypothetical protein